MQMMFIVLYFIGFQQNLISEVCSQFCLTEFQEAEGAVEETKKSNHVERKLQKRQQDRKLDPHVEEQFGSGRLLAAISSRPGQCGRADGYVYSFILPLFIDHRIKCCLRTPFGPMHHWASLYFQDMYLSTVVFAEYFFHSEASTQDLFNDKSF